MVLDNIGSLSQPSSPKHSIRFQRPYAVVTSPAGTLIDVATDDPNRNNSSGSPSPHHMLFPRILMSSRPVGSHKIHAKPPPQPSVNGVATTHAAASNSISPSPTLSSGSANASENKEYVRIAQLLNLDPSKLGNFLLWKQKQHKWNK